MKYLKIVLIIFILFSSYSFNKNKPKLISENTQFENNLIPDDFYFIINSGGNDSYDSKTSSFNRKYIDNEKTVKIELTNEEKQRIFSFMNEVRFLKMPNKFEPKEEIILISNPGFYKSIVIYFNAKQKVVSYNTGYSSEKNKKRAKKFFCFYEMIWSILKNKEELINLPESDLHYK
ncbi:MAG: hypothetical protein H7239_15235 [Flavobacterium sp.]|nr:hypothetical protein [Flavobacterium sp.]